MNWSSCSCVCILIICYVHDLMFGFIKFNQQVMPVYWKIKMQCDKNGKCYRIQHTQCEKFKKPKTQKNM